MIVSVALRPSKREETVTAARTQATDHEGATAA
jgi:hypothetical protein